MLFDSSLDWLISECPKDFFIGTYAMKLITIKKVFVYVGMVAKMFYMALV